MGLVYVVKKSYWKQGEQHASEAIVHAENMLTSKEQINTLVSKLCVICTQFVHIVLNNVVFKRIL